MAEDPKFWVGVVCANHVKIAASEGVCAFSHGKEVAIGKLTTGDRFAYYSPQTGIGEGDKVQGFTAIGTVSEGTPYQKNWAGTAMTAWVRDAQYDVLGQVSIRPLIEHLGFISNPRYWGMAFRRGLFAVDVRDFEMIEDVMRRANG